MSYLNPPYPNNFQELCAAMPLFYLDVLEMRAILRAQGHLLNDICDGMERVVDYNFILTADENTVRKWERALKITPASSYDLDIRKRVIIGNIIGLGHIGEPEIREIYGLFSSKHITVGFSAGIIDLIVDIAKGNFLNVNVQAFLSVLAQRIPAHLTLRFSYQYSACIKIKRRIESWSYRVPECGTIRCGTWWMQSFHFSYLHF